MDGECRRGDNQESILNHQTSEPRYMTYEYLKKLTNVFSEESIIGRGSYGVVYKGVEDGKTIAVKKFKSLFDEKKFMKEVNYLKMLNHKNIVRYIGYCNENSKRKEMYNGKLILAEDPHMLLCMEYLPNGSLRDYIADKSSRLDWREWYTIIEGISQGLNYLLGQDPPVTHLDLKPENILLDDNMEPKVADFGLSRLLYENNTIETVSFAGTLGYMPPERIDENKISTRFDIFSFGVIILEIITGHRKYPAVNEAPFDDFIETQLQKWRETKLNKQDNISFKIHCQQIKRCIRIGLRCVHPDREKRPEMKVIIQMLRNYGDEDISVPEELIRVEPPELRFCLEPNKRIRCLVNISNLTHQHVMFHCRVKAASNHYSFEPEKGTLCPLRTLTVSFVIEELGELPLDFQCHDQLLVTSTKMPDNNKHLPTSMRYRAYLTVVYERPVRPVQPPSVPRAGFPENQYMDILINCIRQNLGFSDGRPIAACVVYRCLLQWKSFEVERTDHFDRIMTCMHSAVYNQDYSELAYWLSNSCTLLVLMQRTLETAPTTIFGPRRRLKFVELVKRIIEELKGNPGFHNTHLIEELSGHKARRPAMLFKRHLTSFLEKVYEIIMYHVTQELRQLFFCSITEPTISQTLFDHWQVIEQILTKYSTVLKSNYAPPFLIGKFFTQVFSNINAQLFNILLRQKKCYYSSNAKYVKAGLERLEVWCSSQTEEYAGSSWEQLRHIRETVRFLVVGGKSKKTLTDISNLCPVLSKPHLYQIITMHSANTDSTNIVSPEVHLSVASSKKRMIEHAWTEDSMKASVEDSENTWTEDSMNKLMEDSKNASMEPLEKERMIYEIKVDSWIRSISLEPRSIPFSVDDIAKSLVTFVDTNVDVPTQIRKNPCFNFLHERTD
ncbi:hypothetical protein ACQ4PT_037416 [Festuca glaucescens]